MSKKMKIINCMYALYVKKNVHLWYNIFHFQKGNGIRFGRKRRYITQPVLVDSLVLFDGHIVGLIKTVRCISKFKNKRTFRTFLLYFYLFFQ